ncbi:uncharacterized protein TNCV_331871 [Trichonephila clavipes]|nr:uncharacterized protein TNCV_331871 [Trichonephila clavipes]
MRPAYPCDEWDGKTRTCWLDRNIGDTVTFVLAFNRGAKPLVQWTQEFHIFDFAHTRDYVIDPENEESADVIDNIPVYPDMYVARDGTEWIPHNNNVPSRFAIRTV